MIDDAINNFKIYVDNQDSKLYNYIDNKLSILNNELTALIAQKVNFLINYVNSENDLIRYQLKLELDKIQKQIDELEKKGFKIINPTSRSS